MNRLRYLCTKEQALQKEMQSSKKKNQTFFEDMPLCIGEMVIILSIFEGQRG